MIPTIHARKHQILDGSPGLVVMGDDSCREVVGLNPGAIYWMELIFFNINLLQKLYCLFEKTQNKQKRGRGWPI